MMALHCTCTLTLTVKHKTYLGMIGSGKSVLYSKDPHHLFIQFVLELCSLVSSEHLWQPHSHEYL